MRTSFSPAQLTDPHTAASERAIRKCVHCGFCTATCPTYVLLGDELDSPRGRIYLIKDMLENERTPSAEVVKHLDRCLSCLSCMTTCPSGVNYMHLIDHARAYVEARHRRPLADRLLRGLLAATLPRPRRFRLALTLARAVSGLAPLFGRPGPLRPVGAMLALAGRPVPKAPAAPETAPAAPVRGKIVMLQGCAEPVLRPQVQAAAKRLLNRTGYEIVPAPGEVCCGALTLHMGREAEALDFARRNVDAWSALIDRGLTAVVATASGCGLALKEYGRLLAGDPAYAERAAKVSALARDLTELVFEAGLPPVVRPPGRPVVYHAPCSLQHGQKVLKEPKALLAAAGFDVREPAEAWLCCGSAGTYNILQPEIAGRLRERKLDNLNAAGPGPIVSGNIGCLTQLSGTDRPVVHIAELLDWACGGPDPTEP